MSKIGLNRIEWVGHQLDAEGLHFSAEQFSEIINKREYPVLFWSRSFKRSELNWKTQDNECFAIYKALQKF
eukprot:gene33618-biopygen26616